MRSRAATVSRHPATVQHRSVPHTAAGARRRVIRHAPATSRGSTPPVAAPPAASSHGNSQNAPGHNKSKGAHGNPHTSGTSAGSGNGVGNGGSPPGRSVSANAPGHTKLPGSPAAGTGSHASASGLAHSNRNSS